MNTLEKIDGYLGKLEERRRKRKYYDYIDGLVEDIEKEDYKDVSLAIQEKLQKRFLIEEDEAEQIVEKWNKLNEGDPHGTDDVDWDKVKKAVINAAKDIHKDVDMKKIDGIMKNLYKHKPNDTENAIQIGVDMLRAK